MKLYTAQELYKLLSESDECVWIEAKGESDSAQSLMESVCSSSNEPGLGGGYILLGIGEDTKALDNRFWIEGVENPDKAQLDISTRCASMFNLSVKNGNWLIQTLIFLKNGRFEAKGQNG